MDLMAIRDHWESAGLALDPDSPITPTSRDPFLAHLERANILGYLRPDQRVLEVGCGIGTHTRVYAERVRSILGMDLAGSLIDLARTHAAGPNIEYLTGSVLNLISRCEELRFDAVISQRCLINLPTACDQTEAIRQIAAVLKPGGLLLLTEGFQEPLSWSAAFCSDAISVRFVKRLAAGSTLGLINLSVGFQPSVLLFQAVDFSGQSTDLAKHHPGLVKTHGASVKAEDPYPDLF